MTTRSDGFIRHHHRQEPYAVIPLVRICAGGGGQPLSLPQPEYSKNGTDHLSRQLSGNASGNSAWKGQRPQAVFGSARRSVPNPQGTGHLNAFLPPAVRGILVFMILKALDQIRRGARMRPSEAELLYSVRHVVYEYANLVSSGELLALQHAYPINTHLQDAFLLSCRKMADFFPWKLTKRYSERQK